MTASMQGFSARQQRQCYITKDSLCMECCLPGGRLRCMHMVNPHLAILMQDARELVELPARLPQLCSEVLRPEAVGFHCL